MTGARSWLRLKTLEESQAISESWDDLEAEKSEISQRASLDISHSILSSQGRTDRRRMPVVRSAFGSAF